MNEKKKETAPVQATGKANYKSWKNKETTAEGVKLEKVLNVSSVTDFPELVKNTTKKSVLEGTSLASKLKEVIAAEEEAAILKRLKKGDTPEMILRESCAVLPLKVKLEKEPSELTAPWWVTDTHTPIVFPPFRHKSLAELAQERQYKRFGIHPNKTLLFDEYEYEDTFEDDKVSLPASLDESREMPLEEMEVT